MAKVDPLQHRNPRADYNKLRHNWLYSREYPLKTNHHHHHHHHHLYLFKQHNKSFGINLYTWGFSAMNWYINHTFFTFIISKCCELVNLCPINRSGPVFWDTVYIINWHTLSNVYFMLIFCLLLSRNIQLYHTAIKLSWKFGIKQSISTCNNSTLTLKLANTNVHQKGNGKGKGGSYFRRRVGCSSPFHRPLSQQVDKSLLTVTPGQCDARPTLIFPA